MKSLIVVLLLMCLIALSFAETAKDAKATKNTKAESEPKDDDHSHGQKPYERHSSDHEHHDDDDELHDPAFDHDSFLGKEDAEKFSALTPEESVQRLGMIVDKVDANSDGKVTQDELQKWISYIGKKYVMDDTKRLFDTLKPKDDKVVFDAWVAHSHGDSDKKEVDKEFQEGLERDKRKWKVADQDGDGSLNLEEFVAFIHPEEVPRMRDIVIEDTLHEMDSDKDGFVSLKEYLQDQYHDYQSDLAKKKKLPEWVEKERQEFLTKHDKDKDGKLSKTEVYRWIVPDDFDRSIKEAKHLIEKADDNKDGILTKEEILKHHDLFAGSQATDFGSALNKHEEL